MVATRTDSIDLDVAPPPGGGEGLAMRQKISTALFGDLAAPVRVGRFEVLEEIGAGGMGVVYRARDPKLGRDVAIKVMNTLQVSTRGRGRLIREAQTLARLNHPHVVTVYEVGEFEAQVFVAMEFVAGVNLRDWLREATRSQAEVLALFLDAGRGLAAAHEAGIVHRDFKPANLLLGTDGRVRVADFGLARDDGSRESTGDSAEPPTSSDPLTRTGALVGTPAYMAPEQWAHKKTTAASDQFSYCVSLWEALSGTPPFDHSVVRAAEKDGDLGAPNGLERIPTRLRKPLLRGLHSDPAARWPGLADLVAALQPRGAVPWRGFAVVAVAAGLAGAAAAGGSEPPNDEAVVSPCAVVRARMHKLWNPDERERLRAAHEASAPFAAASCGEIERGLERFAAAWDGAAAEVCEAEVVDPVALTCLEQSVGQAASFATRIGRHDPSLVSRLPIAVDSALGSPRDCARADLAAMPPMPPESSTERAEVARVRASMDDASLALELGEDAVAEQETAHALEAARLTRFMPVVAEALLLQGRLSMQHGDSTEANAEFLDALSVAQRARYDKAVLLALVGLLRTQAFNDANPTTMAPWMALAEATLARLGAPAELATKLDEARLEVLRLTGQLDAAMPIARSLSSGGDESRRPEGQRWARRQEAHILAELGEVAAADAIYSELLSDARRRLGNAHPEVGVLELSLGILHQENPSVAVSHFESALQLLGDSIGEEHLTYARAALGMAMARAALGEIDEAKRLAEQAARVHKERLPKGNSERTGPLILLAEIASAEGRLRDAIGYLKSVVEVIDPQRDRENYGMALNNIAYCHRMLGELDESEPYYRRVRNQGGAGTMLYRFSSVGLAAQKLRHGYNDDARALLLDEARPSLEGDLSEFALETWPLWAILDGASQAEWRRWSNKSEARGLLWLVEETERTRAR